MVKFKWVEVHDGIAIVRVDGVSEEQSGVVWKQSNGSWTGHIYKPMFANIGNGKLTCEKAKKAVLDVIKMQYRDIQAALQNVTIGPTTKS
jgi:hypothetical protein